MISIEKNTDLNFTDVRSIAKEVWPIAYGSILSKEQLDYMLEMMYSIESLQLQAEIRKHHFILAIEDGKALGFASYELNCNANKTTKIHKIYVLSTQQGKGIGKSLIEYSETEALKNNQELLILNVNKYNVAQDFYKKLGFSISFEEVIDIGNNYVMDDYVMEKSLKI